MKRRNFIALTALTAATVSFPFINCSNSNPELDKKLAIPEMLSQLCDEKTILEIGTFYGKALPDNYSLTGMESELLKNTGGKTISSSTAATEINSILKEQVQHDYATGNTVIVNGWVLSVTEARQCALFSLLHKN